MGLSGADMHVLAAQCVLDMRDCERSHWLRSAIATVPPVQRQFFAAAARHMAGFLVTQRAAHGARRSVWPVHAALQMPLLMAPPAERARAVWLVLAAADSSGEASAEVDSILLDMTKLLQEVIGEAPPITMPAAAGGGGGGGDGGSGDGALVVTVHAGDPHLARG